MKIYKLPSITVREDDVYTYFLVVEGDKMFVVMEEARMEGRSHQDCPRRYQGCPSNRLLDPIEVWPEYQTPELMSYIEWVKSGKRSWDHPNGIPI